VEKDCERPVEYYGAAKSVPWTLQEVGQALKDFSGFNMAVFNDAKELVKDAADVVIS